MNDIVFLVGSYVPHQILSINEIIENTEYHVHSFSVSKNFTYIPENKSKFTTNKLDDFNKSTLFAKIKELNPTMLVVAGWMIPEYVWVSKKIKKWAPIPIVAMSDTPWYGTWKQKINACISPFHLKKAFTHLWVAGIKQYDYARKLGFKNEQIIFNSLSADTAIFHKVDLGSKSQDYPKNFLFIGRFTEIKGLRILAEAWSRIADKKGWTFTCIGVGDMKNELIETGQLIIKDYMPQEKLLDEMQNAGCFVLPSIKEPWALVIHEAAAAGLPVICTQTCGAAPHFVIDKHNGFKVKTGDINDLQNTLEIIINSDVETLMKMSVNSRKLSFHITPNILVGSLMQLLKS